MNIYKKYYLIVYFMVMAIAIAIAVAVIIDRANMEVTTNVPMTMSVMSASCAVENGIPNLMLAQEKNAAMTRQHHLMFNQIIFVLGMSGFDASATLKQTASIACRGADLQSLSMTVQSGLFQMPSTISVRADININIQALADAAQQSAARGKMTGSGSAAELKLFFDNSTGAPSWFINALQNSPCPTPFRIDVLSGSSSTATFVCRPADVSGIDLVMRNPYGGTFSRYYQNAMKY